MEKQRVPGVLDADFAAGWVPDQDCDCEWREYLRWRAAGGVAQPPLALVPLDCPEGSFGVREG